MKPAIVFNDGGRSAAGYKGDAGDCVARAIATTSGLPYKTVYDALAKLQKARGKARSARNGIHVKNKPFKDYMKSLGFEWVPLMGIGTGCKVHLSPEDLPKEGRYVLSVSKHYTAWVDGVLYDTFDCSRDGTRCVYGYWFLTKEPEACNELDIPRKPNKKTVTLKQTVVNYCEMLGATAEHIGNDTIELQAPDGMHWSDSCSVTMVCFGWKDAKNRMEQGLSTCSPDDPECQFHTDFESLNGEKENVLHV